MGLFSKHRERLEEEKKKIDISKKANELYIHAYSYRVRYLDYGFNIKRIHSQYEPDEITIDFKELRVFDNRVYLPGVWEELLNELYLEYTRNRNAEHQKSLERSRINERRTSIADTIREIINISGEETVIIDNDILIKYKEMYSETTIDDVEATRFDGYFYSVFVNKELVYSGHAYYRESGIIIEKFSDGTWTDRVVSELDRLKKDTYQNRDAYAREYINKLRKNRK